MFQTNRWGFLQPHLHLLQGQGPRLNHPLERLKRKFFSNIPAPGFSLTWDITAPVEYHKNKVVELGLGTPVKATKTVAETNSSPVDVGVENLLSSFEDFVGGAADNEEGQTVGGAVNSDMADEDKEKDKVVAGIKIPPGALLELEAESIVVVVGRGLLSYTRKVYPTRQDKRDFPAICACRRGFLQGGWMQHNPNGASAVHHMGWQMEKIEDGLADYLEDWIE